MVTTDISQIAAECSTWRQQLRHYREEFTQLKHQLRQLALHVSSKDLLQDVEHYENQFHIQLINIHDLKHSIKANELKAASEPSSQSGQPTDATQAEHEILAGHFHHLEQMLHELKDDFKHFLTRLKS